MFTPTDEFIHEYNVYFNVSATSVEVSTSRFNLEL